MPLRSSGPNYAALSEILLCKSNAYVARHDMALENDLERDRFTPPFQTEYKEIGQLFFGNLIEKLST